MNEKEQLKLATEEFLNQVGKNKKNSPRLSIDPKTEDLAVVGDPNDIPTHPGDYKITFLYPSEELTEEDKARMVKLDVLDYYKATMEYKNKRIKPLYRGKIVNLLTQLAVDTKVLRGDGYTNELDAESLGTVLLEHTDKIGQLIHYVLGVPESQIEYMSPYEVINFLNQLLANEPNILVDSSLFLAQL